MSRLKRAIAFAALLIAIPSAISAQTGTVPASGTARRVIRGAATPATCSVGDVFFKTAATIGTYECTVTNTWTAIGVGGAAGTYLKLDGSNSPLTGLLTVQGSTGVAFPGSTSGTLTLKAPAVAGTNTLTLPAATDTLVGKATVDTLTNKTLTTPTINSPVLTSPALGTVVSGVLTGATGLPIAGISTFTDWATFTPTITPQAGTYTGHTVTTARWMKIGKTISVAISISGGTLSGAPTYIEVTIPGGFFAARTAYYTVEIRNAGVYQKGSAYTVASTTAIGFTTGTMGAGSWIISGSNDITFNFSFETTG